MMTYEETTEWLFAQVPMFQNLGNGAYKPGLATTLALAEAWGNPQKEFKAIHIAGTNGKGSTAHTLAAILQSADYRTGLYTSPHLLDFRERIRVDGVPADKDFVVRFIDEFRNSPVAKLNPSFFELTTIMAFRYFADCNVDVAVIETGLGGRLDSTNILTPELSVITNISLDHTALLGDTESAIAHEKAGIIKQNVPVVIGHSDGDVRKVFLDKAQSTNSPIIFADTAMGDIGARHAKDGIIYSGSVWGDLIGELNGDCQEENARTILAAVDILKDTFPKINADNVRKGFANVCVMTGLMGRWMKISQSPVTIICDTGHNVGGWSFLGPRLCDIADGCGTLHMVVGFVNDKDITSITGMMPRDAVYYFARPSVERARPAESTAEICRAHGLDGNAYNTVEEAFQSAYDAAHPGDTIFVGGSTFVIADFLKYFNQPK